MNSIRIALCQTNPTVGALKQNLESAASMARNAVDDGANLVVFPAMAISGAPLHALGKDEAFHRRVEDALMELASRLDPTCTVIIGVHDEAGTPRSYVVEDGSARTSDACCIGDVRVWVGHSVEDLSNGDSQAEARSDVQLVVVPLAVPYEGISPTWRSSLEEYAAVHDVAVIATNLVGAQDGVVFDGGSVAIDKHGTTKMLSGRFAPSYSLIDIAVRDGGLHYDASNPTGEDADERESTYAALVLGVSDYVKKSGFSDVLIGLSGGIDSSLVATIAVDALGADHVHGIAMPSIHSSDHSLRDARELASVLGMSFAVQPITEAHDVLHAMASHVVEGDLASLADENLQARIRGTLLMTLSNHFGWLVLNTGNKSEAAMGYSTLYGDSVGGLAVLGDVTKTRVYELSRWRNELAVGVGLSAPISESVLTKAPSAELRPGQRDDQSLPPYDILDIIVEGYVERNEPHEVIAKACAVAGMDVKTAHEFVRETLRRIDAAEYKRQQSPPSIKVTSRAFGHDRLMPITKSIN